VAAVLVHITHHLLLELEEVELEEMEQGLVG
jgi:hypothetical protein